MRNRPAPAGLRHRAATSITIAAIEALEDRKLLTVAGPSVGTASGTLYRDADANGLRGPLEAALPGRTVYLDLDGNAALDPTDPATTTGANGAFSFPLPTRDPLAVRQILPAGWAAVGPGSYYVAGAFEHPRLNLGSRQTDATGSVTATVWRDDDGDGVRDPGEPPVDAATVYLDLDNDAARDPDEPGAATDTTGVATIGNVPAGSYVVRTIVPTGWVQTSPAAGAGLNVTVGTTAVNVGPFGVVLIPPPPTTNTPFSGTPIVISATGATTIQAEDFDLGGEGVAWHDTDAANVGGNTAYRAGSVDLSTDTDGGAAAVVLSWVRPGEWLEYTVDVARAGAYDVGFRVASLQAGGALHLEVDGTRIGNPVTVPDTGAWTNWRTLTTSDVQLPAGRHVLRLAFDTAGALGFVGNVNYLTIAPPPPLPGGYTGTPFQGTVAKVNASGASTIEVENFDDGGEGVAYHDTDAANLGGSAYHGTTGVDVQGITDGATAGVGIGYTKAGEWVKFIVDVAADGSYDFDTRLASLTGGGNFHLDVDGTRVTPYLVVPRTGNWGTYTTVRQSGVALKAGRHVFKLAFDANGGSGYVANFNWVKFTRR